MMHDSESSKGNSMEWEKNPKLESCDPVPSLANLSINEGPQPQQYFSGEDLGGSASFPIPLEPPDLQLSLYTSCPKRVMLDLNMEPFGDEPALGEVLTLNEVALVLPTTDVKPNTGTSGKSNPLPPLKLHGVEDKRNKGVVIPGLPSHVDRIEVGQWPLLLTVPNSHKEEERIPNKKRKGVMVEEGEAAAIPNQLIPWNYQSTGVKREGSRLKLK